MIINLTTDDDHRSGFHNDHEDPECPLCMLERQIFMVDLDLSHNDIVRQQLLRKCGLLKEQLHDLMSAPHGSGTKR